MSLSYPFSKWDLQTNTWNSFEMQIIGLHLGPMNHTLWAWGPVICDLKILPANSNACQSLRTTDLILSEFSIPRQLLLIQQWPYVLCWHNKIEDIHLYFTSGDLSLSVTLLLHVGKEVYSPNCHWKSSGDPKGRSLRTKSMPRTVVDKEITESVTLFPLLEVALPLDFIPRGNNFFPLFKLVWVGILCYLRPKQPDTGKYHDPYLANDAQRGGGITRIQIQIWLQSWIILQYCLSSPPQCPEPISAYGQCLNTYWSIQGAH